MEWDEEVPEWVTIDKQKLKQVLDNLFLGNALKFTEKGSIKVDIKSYFFGTTKKTVDLIFNIEDTGWDRKEKLGSLFKSFSQVHAPESNIEKGTGTWALYLQTNR